MQYYGDIVTVHRYRETIAYYSTAYSVYILLTRSRSGTRKVWLRLGRSGARAQHKREERQPHPAAALGFGLYYSMLTSSDVRADRLRSAKQSPTPSLSILVTTP
jgi:hypothetical protein